MKSAERFSRFENPGYYSRVSNSCIPELHMGLDENGFMSIELREKFAPRKVSGTTSIDVRQYEKKEYNTIRFSLIDNSMSSLFYIFCDDLIELADTITDNNSSYQIIVERFFQWKKMFVPPRQNLLTENEIMGLIGEILFMKGTLSERIGVHEALISWSGQEKTRKDFSYNGTWTEVKSISTGKQTIRISSAEQLDSQQSGELAVFSMERMSENYNGITLNRLVTDTMKMFSNTSDRDLFFSKVALQGYEYNPLYDEYVFALSSERHFRVDDGFPRITRADLPAAIDKVLYDILLAQIAGFETD